MLKIYYKALVLLVVLLGWGGFAMPYLISAKDDLLVVLGLAISGLALPGVYYLITSISKDIVNEAEKASNRKDA